jgi:1-acyl-sn-glycerol-3-phosphate acyltransferase
VREWNYDNEQWVRLPSYLKHLPLFTRHIDFGSFVIRSIWSIVLKCLCFKFYIRLEVLGSFKEIYQTHPKLLLISNHASHLDAVSIAASVPFRYWPHLFIAAAKDYFFTNPLFTFFSKHCLGAIPIDRKDKKGEAVNLILSLLQNLDRIWLIIFPEGTRSKDGSIQEFKRGIQIFSERTQTPILFIYIAGNTDLWPKGRLIPKPGKLNIFIGPVIPPGPVEDIHQQFITWVKSLPISNASLN